MQTSDIFADYISEADFAAARGVGVRTLRGERQRGVGAPWLKIGKKIFYHRSGAQEWLKGLIVRPVRSGHDRRASKEAAR